MVDAYVVIQCTYRMCEECGILAGALVPVLHDVTAHNNDIIQHSQEYACLSAHSKGQEQSHEAIDCNQYQSKLTYTKYACKVPIQSRRTSSVKHTMVATR